MAQLTILLVFVLVNFKDENDYDDIVVQCILQEYEPGTEALAQLACPFLLEPSVPETLLYTLPICLLLICNTAFLIWIMGVSHTFNLLVLTKDRTEL